MATEGRHTRPRATPGGAAATGGGRTTNVRGMFCRARLPFAALALVVGATTLPAATSGVPVAVAAAPSRFVTGWVPYWESKDGVVGFGTAPGVFADQAAFNFSATGASAITLVGGTSALAASVGAMRAQGLPVFATITDGTPKLAMQGILLDPTTRAQHVQAIVTLAVTNGYDGIDLDYEGFAFDDGRASWANTQPGWIAFVNELANALHANGRLLSVTVPPIWDAGKSGYWVYSWPEIIANVDRLRLMVYDWSFSAAGPIAPISWVQNVLSYVGQVIPPVHLHKVQLGVPTYGRNWAKVVSGTCPSNASLGTTSVQMSNAASLAASKGATPVRDVSGEMTFTYDTVFEGTLSMSLTPPTYTPPATPAAQVEEADPTGLAPAVRVMAPGAPVKCTVRRTVYYPDATSVLQRAQAAVDAGISGIAIWALGYETSDVWSLLSTVDAGRPAGNAIAGNLEGYGRTNDVVSVTGWAADLEFDLPVTIRITVNGSEFARRVARLERTDLAGAYPGIDPMHGFTESVGGVPAGAQVCVQAWGWGSGAGWTTVSNGCQTI